MDAARRYAAGRVEKGVTGKEKMFQQSREFGPGPIKPYPGASPTLRGGQRPQYRAPYARGGRNDGVYRGPKTYGTKNGVYKRGEQPA